MSVILLGMRAGLVVLALGAISMMLLGLTGYSHFYPQNAHPNSFGTVTIFRLNYTCGRIPHAHLRQVDQGLVRIPR